MLGLAAVAVLVHFVFNPFYRALVKCESVWAVLNWFMLFTIVALITVIAARRAAGKAGTNGRPMFYVATVLGIQVFWNWFNELAVGGGNESQVHGIFGG